jgi:FeoB-associated Cys-rich membrane protein
MTPGFQTFAASLAVVLAAAWLGFRAYSRRAKPGCGGDCGCPAAELKEHVRSREKASGTGT